MAQNQHLALLQPPGLSKTEGGPRMPVAQGPELRDLSGGGLHVVLRPYRAMYVHLQV